MLSDKTDRIQKINEAMRGFITEKSYMLSGGKVVETDAPGGDKIFGIGQDGDLSKAHVYRGGKKVYLNRPSYNKPLVSSTKLGDTQETPAAAAPKKADSLASSIYTAPESNVPVITQPLLRSEPKSVSMEPKITDPLTSLGGPFKTTAKPTTPAASQAESKSKVGISRQEMNKALEAVYKHGSTKEMPLASRSELEGFTRQDIENSRRAAIAPKPKPPAKPMTGGRGRLEMEPVYTESVENYANYLGEARGDGFTKKARRRQGAKAAKTEQPAQQQPFVPMAPDPKLSLGQEDQDFLNKVEAESRNRAKYTAARKKGVAAAQAYVSAHPRKTGILHAIKKILGRGR